MAFRLFKDSGVRVQDSNKTYLYEVNIKDIFSHAFGEEDRALQRDLLLSLARISNNILNEVYLRDLDRCSNRRLFVLTGRIDLWTGVNSFDMYCAIEVYLEGKDLPAGGIAELCQAFSSLLNLSERLNGVQIVKVFQRPDDDDGRHASELIKKLTSFYNGKPIENLVKGPLIDPREIWTPAGLYKVKWHFMGVYIDMSNMQELNQWEAYNFTLLNIKLVEYPGIRQKMRCMMIKFLNEYEVEISDNYSPLNLAKIFLPSFIDLLSKHYQHCDPRFFLRVQKTFARLIQPVETLKSKLFEGSYEENIQLFLRSDFNFSDVKRYVVTLAEAYFRVILPLDLTEDEELFLIKDVLQKTTNFSAVIDDNDVDAIQKLHHIFGKLIDFQNNLHEDEVVVGVRAERCYLYEVDFRDLFLKEDKIRQDLLVLLTGISNNLWSEAYLKDMAADDRKCLYVLSGPIDSWSKDNSFNMHCAIEVYLEWSDPNRDARHKQLGVIDVRHAFECRVPLFGPKGDGLYPNLKGAQILNMFQTRADDGHGSTTIKMLESFYNGNPILNVIQKGPLINPRRRSERMHFIGVFIEKTIEELEIWESYNFKLLAIKLFKCGPSDEYKKVGCLMIKFLNDYVDFRINDKHSLRNLARTFRHSFMELLHNYLRDCDHKFCLRALKNFSELLQPVKPIQKNLFDEEDESDIEMFLRLNGNFEDIKRLVVKLAEEYFKGALPLLLTEDEELCLVKDVLKNRSFGDKAEIDDNDETKRILRSIFEKLIDFQNTLHAEVVDGSSPESKQAS